MDQQTHEEEKKKQFLDVSQLTGVLRPIGNFFKRHLILLFIVLTLSALIYAVLMVNLILQQSESTSDSSVGIYETRFDQGTIDKINDLSNNGQTPTVDLPSGRINPFSE